MDILKKEHHQKIYDVIARMCRSENVSIAELKAGSRRKEVSGVRARIAIGLVKRHGVALAEVARRVGGIHLGHIKNPKTEPSINRSIKSTTSAISRDNWW
jgi:hypothetical protein